LFVQIRINPVLLGGINHLSGMPIDHSAMLMPSPSFHFSFADKSSTRQQTSMDKRDQGQVPQV
jgi:hypothetical protein